MKPSEHKTVQARILAYAQEIGWTFVPREEAEERRAGWKTRAPFEFNDKDVDTLIGHFRDPARRQEFFKEYKEIEMLYEIISPDAFLRPFIDDYGTLAAIYDVVRKACARRVMVDRDFQKKTNELVQKHIGAGFNADLLGLKPELWDYVIVHELLHFFVPNHGKLWKSLMRAHLGEYEAYAAALKDWR